MAYVRLAIEFLQVIAWPALVLYALVAYRDPLRRLLLVIPKKLAQTSKLSFGSLVVDMQTTLINVGDPALAKELPHLSRAAYEELLSMKGDDSVFSLIVHAGTEGQNGIQLTDPDELAVARELYRVGLIKGDEPVDTFIQYVQSLPHTPRPFGGTWISEASLSREQSDRLQNTFYKLTPRARRLYKVMVNVILSNLTSDSARAASASVD